MTIAASAPAADACFNCGGPRLRTRLDDVPGVRSGRYRIVQCVDCAMAFIQTQAPEHVDYSDYGDHISTQDEGYYAARLARVSAPKRLLFRWIERRYGREARILDFGAGAGFFMRSCLNHGFRRVYGIEPSLKLRGIAEQKLGVAPDTMAADVGDLGESFDVIAMLDVIEHLPVDAIDEIMRRLVQHMRPGGVLLGTTPNLESLNVRLSATRDPVIAPPQHTIYFTPASLDDFLRRLGLRRRLLIAAGLSTNSFFRTEKFAPSWVERPRGWQRPVAVALRALFAGAGLALTPFGRGYGMYFVYEKPAADG